MLCVYFVDRMIKHKYNYAVKTFSILILRLVTIIIYDLSVESILLQPRKVNKVNFCL